MRLWTIVAFVRSTGSFFRTGDFMFTEADHQIYGCMTRVVTRNTCIIFRKDALDKGEDGE